MTVNVLVVDDSLFFRHRIKEILNADPQLQVIATASNGAEAVALVERLRPDVVTMDIEMPVMDGIAAVREIMGRCPTPILMFSSLTTEGARVTLDALDAGALDFLPKNFYEIAEDQAAMREELCKRVRAMAGRLPRGRPAAAEPAGPYALQMPPPGFRVRDFELVAIGASTGGPAALQTILKLLPAGFPRPLVLIQHMPASFTPPFAHRLDQLCRIRVKHAEDGDMLRPGIALLAPGGRQMQVTRAAEGLRVQVIEAAPDQTYRPSVDVTFESLARAVPGRVLAIVLTGMGRDGCEGARALKQKNAMVWAQDEASSVVNGMPLAVARAGLCDAVLPLWEIGRTLAQDV